ncbi:MAG: PadR family transcriptional regulator [Candidatus Aminicenantes bacterium]|nr:PadR family transcriptional regulator [Candidatus Aminicenantes bacterium]
MVTKALIAASTKPMILSILVGGENYGYQIIQSVKEISGGTLEWSDGMLYPVLHRLEKDNFIRSNWKMSDGGRLRKYYTITHSGKEELAKEKIQWMFVHDALSKLWEPLPAF